MSSALAALFLASSCVSVIAPALVVAIVAVMIFIGGTGATLSPTAIVLVVSAIAAIPSAALLATGWMRPMLEGSSRKGRSAVELLAVVLAAALAFHDGGVLVAATEVVGSVGLVSVGAIALVFSRILITAAVVALALSLVTVFSEVVVVWGARAARVRYPISQAALRQLVLLLAMAAGLDLILGAFVSQLAPLTLTRGLLP